jgi:hypothetical protein
MMSGELFIHAMGFLEKWVTGNKKGSLYMEVRLYVPYFGPYFAGIFPEL